MNKLDAKKSLGQHWLNDDASLEAMCEAAEVSKGDVVLEVGPGKGSLTTKLLERGATVVAVEFDESLLLKLKQRFEGKAFELHYGSILEFDLNTLPKDYKVVANIPYYLTSHLLRQLCESPNPFKQAALLIQKEVAERVVAESGDMSLLSISVQFYCQTGLGPVVPAELFTPPPKVDSQILMLDYSGARFQDVDTKEFFRLIKAGFSERRKMLRSSLSGGLQMSKPETSELLKTAAINPESRAQELTLDDWYQLYLALVGSK